LTGNRAPDLALRSGRLYEALRAGRFVLIAPGPSGTGQAGQAEQAERAERAGERAGRLTVERWAGERRTTLLVRPDGYVAWAAESPDPAAVEAALTAAVGS
jgi:hypothetical protein